MTRYFVESRHAPPNSDVLTTTEHNSLKEALEVARSLKNRRVWRERTIREEVELDE